jgi:hypothetical protein
MEEKPKLEDFLLDVKKRIRKRKRFETADSWLYQTFLWLSILSSFTTAVLAAVMAAEGTKQNNALYTAISAAISAFVLSIDKHFSFGKRALWNSVFRCDLEAILRDVYYNIDPLEKGVERLNKLDREMEANFPNLKRK